MPNTLPIIATGNGWKEVLIPNFGILVDTRKSYDENYIQLTRFFQKYPEEPESYWKRALSDICPDWEKLFSKRG